MNSSTEEKGMLERGVCQFWLASKAWYREDGFYEGWNAGKLIDVLADLSEVRTHALKEQASALMVQVVNAKRRRKKVKGAIVDLQAERIRRLKQEGVKKVKKAISENSIRLAQ